jgi:cytochrome c biogenesis protein CcdA
MIEIPFLGATGSNLPIPILGMILGFLDGAFNPCALSVLFFLAAYLLAIGTRKKTLTLGLIYSLMVFLVYFLFMYGTLNIFFIVGYLEIIKIVVGIVVTAAGLIQIKDFFFYGKWLSLEIPKSAKPMIENLIKRATLPSVIFLGIFVSLVEIPCAGGFPLAFLAIISSKTGIENIFYLGVYNFFFVLPLIILTLVFCFGFVRIERAERARVKLRKYMRIISGIVLLAMGLLILMRWI